MLDLTARDFHSHKAFRSYNHQSFEVGHNDEGYFITEFGAPVVDGVRWDDVETFFAEVVCFEEFELDEAVRMMAEHDYHYNEIESDPWDDYFVFDGSYGKLTFDSPDEAAHWALEVIE